MPGPKSTAFSLKSYLVYARAPFVTASVVPVFLGTSLAWRGSHSFDGVSFTLTLAGMVFAHFGMNLFNDYYDFRQGADLNNRFRNRFSGGSPHLVDGRETPERIRSLAVLSLFVALCCGVALSVRVDRGLGPVLWLMIAGAFGGYCYTAPPLKFVYRGWGELFIFMNFGVLPVLGAYYVQSGSLSWIPPIVSMPVAFLVTNILYINQFPDHPSDRDAGKRTLVVRLGTRRARYLYLVFWLLSLLFIGVPILSMDFPVLYVAAMLGVLPAIPATVVLFRYHDNPSRLLTAQALTIIAHMATGSLLVLATLI